jgi:hypothetical protein
MASQKFCDLRPVAGLIYSYSKHPSSNPGCHYTIECIVVSLVSAHLVAGCTSGLVCQMLLCLGPHQRCLNLAVMVGLV